MKILKNKWFIAFTIIIILLFGAGIGVGNYFVNYALSPASNSDERQIDENDIIGISDESEKIISENELKEDNRGSEFLSKTTSASITGNDGITLKSKYLEGNDKHLWTVIIHGYKSDNVNMMAFGAEYYERGYNVLLPDNRAHGESEGDYIGMGWLDKDDITCWINWIMAKDPQAKVILHGVSMGGATTMMLSGDNNENVIGYIEDCGYTSVWDIFASELDKRFSLPTFPVLDISNLVAKAKAGYDFKKASAIEQVKKCQKPMLFIHGGMDDFVPTDMVYQLYDAATCEKDIYIVEQAGHGEAKNYNPQAYWNSVFTFINEKILNV